MKNTPSSAKNKSSKTKKTRAAKGVSKRQKKAPFNKSSINKTSATANKSQFSLWRVIWRFSILGFFMCVFIGAGIMLYYANDLPPLATSLKNLERKQELTILDAHNQLILRQGALQYPFEKIDSWPDYVSKAFVAIEDKAFYDHMGIYPKGIARAMVQNMMNGRVSQGASTITQQLAKNLFLSPERSIKRKMHELFYAFWLEHEFKKDDILSLYLNYIYFGEQCYGIEAASRFFFQKPARFLTVAEAAILAGSVKAPSRLHILANTKKSIDRAQIVVRLMKEQGYINEQQAMTAEIELSSFITFQELSEMRRQTRSNAKGLSSSQIPSLGYVADFVRQEFVQYMGGKSANMLVRSSIHSDWQKTSENVIKEMLSGLDPSVNAAVVIMDLDGRIKTMIGGKDYQKSNFNRASLAKRQPGSTLKPFIYALAMQEFGLTPDDWTIDEQRDYNGFQPRNWNNEYIGDVTLKDALAKSLNTVAVDLLHKIGPDKLIDFLRQAGVSSHLGHDLSLALGSYDITPIELASAYVTLFNGGRPITPSIIDRIQTYDDILYDFKPHLLPSQLDPGVIAMMQEMLRATITDGTGYRANVPGLYVMGKTGTSDQNRDGWLAGFVESHVMIVWVGADDNKTVQLQGGKRLSGSNLPAQIFHKIAKNIF